MGFIALILLAIGLSMDAFAVAICKGLKMQEINRRQTLIIALFFGGFQAIMPLIGWLLGSQFERYIVSVDHWIAFGLLIFIGGKMIWEALKGNEEEELEGQEEAFDLKELLMLAIATSIDALAVGITFAFLRVNIWLSILLIGIITFGFAILGVVIGNRFGERYKNKAELAGGIILILIGLKILIEHLGFF